MITKLFVYGTVKKGYSNWPVIARIPYIHRFSARVYDHYLVNVGAFPGMVPKRDVILWSGARSGVTGEVIEYDEKYIDDVLCRLDTLEGYLVGDAEKSMFIRRKVTCYSGHATEIQDHMCWTYLYNYSIEKLPIIPEGIWKDRE